MLVTCFLYEFVEFSVMINILMEGEIEDETKAIESLL